MFPKIYYDDSQIDQLYNIIMSRLPDIKDFDYSKNESSPDIDVWISKEGIEIPWTKSIEFGKILIIGQGIGKKLQ